MSRENLPVKNGKKSNIFKRGLAVFLSFIGISNGAYAQAKVMDEYKDDYNSNTGYNEKAEENIDEKYNNAFEAIGVSDKIVEDKIADKDISDKMVEDKTNSIFAELRENVNDDLSQYVEDKFEDKSIEDKSITEKDIEDKEI